MINKRKIPRCFGNYCPNISECFYKCYYKKSCEITAIQELISEDKRTIDNLIQQGKEEEVKPFAEEIQKLKILYKIK